jgi:hypothetical protein
MRAGGFAGPKLILGQAGNVSPRDVLNDASPGKSLMSEVDKYRQNAEFAVRMADRATSKERKSSWLKIAAGWLSLLPWHRTPAHKPQAAAPEPPVSGGGGNPMSLSPVSEPQRD